jgi:hypothetical protein
MCVAFKSHSLSVECLFPKIRFESKGKFISLVSLGSAIQCSIGKAKFKNAVHIWYGFFFAHFVIKRIKSKMLIIHFLYIFRRSVLCFEIRALCYHGSSASPLPDAAL